MTHQALIDVPIISANITTGVYNRNIDTRLVRHMVWLRETSEGNVHRCILVLIECVCLCLHACTCAYDCMVINRIYHLYIRVVMVTVYDTIVGREG